MKATRRSIIKKLDKLFSEKIRSVGFCQHCGKKSGLQCAHIFSRKNYSIRWDEENAVCLCLRCHLYWAHKEPVEFTKWVTEFKNIPYLENKINNPISIKTFELEELLNNYKNERNL